MKNRSQVKFWVKSLQKEAEYCGEDVMWDEIIDIVTNLVKKIALQEKEISKLKAKP